MTTKPDGQPHTICRTCFVEHAEDCNTCFGFGVKARELQPDGDRIPLAAGRAHRIYNGGCAIHWERCPECHGTPFGIQPE